MYTEETITADFKTTPYNHQLLEFETHGLDQARALLWQMRCGKTKLTIDSVCALFKADKIDAVIVFAPNGVHTNWLTRELPAHNWDTVPYKTFNWNSKTCGEKTSGTKAWKANFLAWHKSVDDALKDTTQCLWFAFNSEVMTRNDVKKLAAKIVKKRRVMLVFDESHNYGSTSSGRTKMARSIAKRCEYKRILTGTVVTNSPLHAFSQFELLSPGALGHDKFGTFKDQYATYTMQQHKRGFKYPVLNGYKNLDELQEQIAKWSSVVLRTDCNDLPDLIRRQIRIQLNDAQKKLYKELRDKFTFEIDGKEVTIGENAAKLAKLQQVVSGFIIDEFKQTHLLPGVNERLEVMSEEVMLSPGKVIVWCQYKQDIDSVYERLTADGHEVLQYHGRTSTQDKAKARSMFAPEANNDVKALVGHPLSGGQGLDLSAASKIIWYSHTFDAIIRGQADERATKIGGKNIELIDIVAPGVDEYILENVLNKVTVAESLAGEGLKQVLERIALE